MTPKIVVQPTVEPVSLEEARLHCAVDLDESESPPSSPFDPLLEGFIATGREWCENYTGRALAEQTIEIALDTFPCDEVMLPMPPLLSVVSITYVDADENVQTVDPALYTIDNYQEPGWLLPAEGTNWPTPKAVVNAVKIRYKAGYNESLPLPKSIKSAIKLVMAHYFENRENSFPGTGNGLQEIPMPARSLLETYRIYTDNAV